MKINHIYHGDCLKVLSSLPSKSIDMSISSPPYWALRDYGIEPSIWDGDKVCEHDFEEIEEKQEGYNNTRRRWQHGATRETEPENWNKSIKKHGFCKKCNAWKGSLGLEPDFNLFIKHLCDIYDEVKRVLKPTGTCWVNLGDTYYTKSGSGFLNDNLTPTDEHTLATGINKANELRGGGQLPSKCLTLVPFRFAIEMVNRGWVLRNVIIWHKPNCMPSSIKDRFTVDFEYIFFFSKKKKYYFETQYEKWTDKRDSDIQRATNNHKGYQGKYGEGYNKEYRKLLGGQGIKGQPVGDPSKGRNKRCVWKITTKPFKEAHFAVYPEDLIITPIKAGCPEFVCKKCGKPREKILELSEKYKKVLENIKGLPSGNLQVGYANYKSKTQSCTADYKCIGYTDCGCNAGFESGVVLDPFMGSGTTALVSLKNNRRFVGIELNPEYIDIALKRIKPHLEQQRLGDFK